MIENKVLKNTRKNLIAIRDQSFFCCMGWGGGGWGSWRALGESVEFSGGTEGNQSLPTEFKRGTMKY